MKKLLLIFIFLFFTIVKCQKNIYDFQKVEYSSLIGKYLFAIPRQLNKDSRQIPGIFIFKNGEYKEINTFDDYEKYISNKIFRIESFKTTENKIFTEFILSNNNQIYRWDTKLGFGERGFILEDFLNEIKIKTINKNFIYESYKNQYKDAKSEYDFNEEDILNGINIEIVNSESEFSRFKSVILRSKNLRQQDKIINILDFDFNKYYSYDKYEKIVFESKNNRLEREKKIIKKYGKVIGNKLLLGEIWIGMSKQMLMDSRGEPTRIGLITETKSTYSVQYIYESTTFGTEYIYIENGKVAAIQTL